MSKRLLKKIFSTRILSIFMAVAILCLSVFGASRININQETDLLTLIIGFIFLLAAFASLLFISLMISDFRNQKDERKK